MYILVNIKSTWVQFYNLPLKSMCFLCLCYIPMFFFQIIVVFDYMFFKKTNKFEFALKMLETIIKDFSFEILIDDALFQAAKIYDYNIKNKEKANKYYQKIILDHEGSIYASQARERFRFLRGDNLSNDL